MNTEKELTGATALKIHKLYNAGIMLTARAAGYAKDGDFKRAMRANRASHRLCMRAYGLLIDTLTATELRKLCALTNPKTHGLAARATQPA